MSASDPRLTWSGDMYGVRSEDGIKFETTFREVWTVLLLKTDPLSAANAAAGIPLVGGSPTSNPFLRVVSKQARRISPIMAEVELDCSAPTNGDGSGGGNPLNQPPEINIDFEYEEIGFDLTPDKKRICTPAGEPYRNLTTRRAITVFTIQRNLQNFDLDLAESYINCVNSSTFLKRPAGRVIADGFSARSVIVPNGISYAIVMARFRSRRPDPGQTDEKAWYKKELRAGLFCRVRKGLPSQNTWIVTRCKDTLHQPASVPMVLNADGTQKALPETGDFDNTDTDCWEYFKEFETKNLNDLKLL